MIGIVEVRVVDRIFVEIVECQQGVHEPEYGRGKPISGILAHLLSLALQSLVKLWRGSFNPNEAVQRVFEIPFRLSILDEKVLDSIRSTSKLDSLSFHLKKRLSKQSAERVIVCPWDPSFTSFVGFFVVLLQMVKEHSRLDMRLAHTTPISELLRGRFLQDVFGMGTISRSVDPAVDVMVSEVMPLVLMFFVICCCGTGSASPSLSNPKHLTGGKMDFDIWQASNHATTPVTLKSTAIELWRTTDGKHVSR